MALWMPSSAHELEDAITTGSVVESHQLEFKELADGGVIPNTVAKGVASLAIDGGVLVLGVGEDKSKGQWLTKPFALLGIRDRVDASLTTRISPVLRLTYRPLDLGDGTGYLAIVVPQSLRAPHMVDGKYYQRTDSGCKVCSDEEVRRLWLRHLDRREDRRAMLELEVNREPVPFDQRRNARLFVVAQPVSADSRLLLESFADRDLWRWTGPQAVFATSRTYAPSIGERCTTQRRARGVGYTNELESDRTVSQDLSTPRNVVDVELWEDGGVRLYYGRASDVIGGEQLLLLGAIAGEVSGVVELARLVSTQAGFYGSWTFAVALRGLKSLRSHTSNLVSGEPQWRFSEDFYDESLEVDNATLFDGGSPVLSELLGRFLRAAYAYTTGIELLDVFPRDV